jgi:hypothetical protein
VLIAVRCLPNFRDRQYPPVLTAFGISAMDDPTPTGFEQQ